MITFEWVIFDGFSFIMAATSSSLMGFKYLKKKNVHLSSSKISIL